MSDMLILLGGMCLGISIGSWWTWHNWLKSEKPKLHITVDRDVLSLITQEMAMDWAERRGLTWQPKGAVFDPYKEVKK